MASVRDKFKQTPEGLAPTSMRSMHLLHIQFGNSLVISSNALLRSAPGTHAKHMQSALKLSHPLTGYRLCCRRVLIYGPALTLWDQGCAGCSGRGWIPITLDRQWPTGTRVRGMFNAANKRHFPSASPPLSERVLTMLSRIVSDIKTCACIKYKFEVSKAH